MKKRFFFEDLTENYHRCQHGSKTPDVERIVVKLVVY
jgi:hypothetical protein